MTTTNRGTGTGTGTIGRTDVRGASAARTAMVVLAAVTLALPVNFVALTPSLEQLSRAALLGGALVGAVLLVAAGPHVSLVVGVPLLLLVVTSSAGGGDVVDSILTVAPFVVGVGLGFATRGRWLRVAVVVLAANALSLVLDRLTSGGVSTALGSPLLPLIEASLSRSRGFIGQAVPSAMVSVYLFAVCLLLARRLTGVAQRSLTIVLVVAATVVSLLLTGTRSALIVLVLTIVLASFAARTGERRTIRVHPALVFLALAGVVAATAAAPRVIRLLEASRLFQFTDLAGSESLVNRLYSGAILQTIAQTCDLPCLVLGSGPRDLQAVLLTSLGILGLATIDNMFVTLLWDFGIAGLTVVAVVLVRATWLVFDTRAAPGQRAGAVAVWAVVASFAAYDALYVRPVLLLFGLFVAMMLSPRHVGAGWSSQSRSSVGEAPPVGLGRPAVPRGRHVRQNSVTKE